MMTRERKNGLSVLESDLIVGVDVDDTLIAWQPIGFDLGIYAPEITPDHQASPQHATSTIEIEFDGKTRKYFVFGDNVESLKAHAHKGHSIIVWSGSGWRWANAVVEALDLKDYVSLVTSKPRWLLDDMKPADFLPTPYWGAGDPGKTKLK